MKEFKYNISVETNWHSKLNRGYRDWLKLNVNADDYNIVWNAGKYVLYLRHAEDLLVFKLRWEI